MLVEIQASENAAHNMLATTECQRFYVQVTSHLDAERSLRQEHFAIVDCAAFVVEKSLG